MYIVINTNKTIVDIIVKQQSSLWVKNRIVAKEKKSKISKKLISIRKNLFIKIYSIPNLKHYKYI